VTRIVGREGVVAHALSAIEQALWDAQSRSKGVPVWSAISPGEDPQRGPALYGTVWCPTSEEKSFDLGRQARAKGLAGVKIAYSAGLLDPVVEQSRLLALRSGLGDDRSIMIDWQTRGSLPQLIERLPGYHAVGVSWVEEPFDLEDFSSYERAAGISDIPLAAGESETRLLGFQRLADAGVQVLQPDIGRCGGYLAAMDVARLATSLGIGVVPHSWSTAIIDAVNLHWAIACKLDLIEMPFQDNRNTPGMVEFVDYNNRGHLAVPSGAGLGITINLDGYIQTESD
jgi:L-alanine-DL-glutamate epimerase-like enolase superfamily enzyme